MYYQFGISFIEVIVSLLLLAIILLGLDAMQITALREQKSAYYFSVASQQLLNMANRLDSLNEFDLPKEMASWNKQNSEVLPEGYGVVTGQYPMTLAIFWGGATEQTCRANKIGQSGCLYFLK